MNRIDRLMGFVTTLQSKKFVAAEALAEKFEISVRTVYRDIKALNEIGVPVSFEPHKGYFIVQGYFLPPVSFTADEANALVLMETLAEKFGDISIKKHYGSALFKIKSVMKSGQKETTEHLHSQIKIYIPPDETRQFDYLSSIQTAITDKILLKIEYTNNQKEKSIREIEPIGLTFYGLEWHVIAWCWLRKEYRDFKVSRISKLSNQQVEFKKKKHIDINEYIKSLG